ncbi:hypothetical protein BKA81DRAFT_197612 [Phyllosticta paracitricarpa]
MDERGIDPSCPLSSLSPAVVIPILRFSCALSTRSPLRTLFSLSSFPFFPSNNCHTTPSLEFTHNRASRLLPHPNISPPQPSPPSLAHTPEAAALPNHLIVTHSPPMPPLSSPVTPPGFMLLRPSQPARDVVLMRGLDRNPSSFIMPKKRRTQ